MTDALIEAGAILPGQAKAGSGQDTVTARRYTHKVLEKTIVRLVGATVGPAEDLSMEFLGFEAEAPPVTVGHGRRQALGFPAWALVNDPANGRHALALVKDMERLARVAKSKPGNAKEGYDALATRLGGAAPQFLPTFWEQAGRAFLAADNPRMAGTCFTLARRAEQVHGLPIDEERLREVHLEFAFGGALTAKMLTEFARGVSDRQPAPAAYELVRTLAVRRVAGGLAPQVSLADELAKMARAAKLDPDAEAQSVVGQLITFPAMARAPMAVWKGYRKALVKLAKGDIGVRSRLLEIMPEPPGYNTDGTDEWLELLEATGAVDLLVSPDSEVEAGAAGRWLERLLAHRQRRHVKRSARVISLVERMVPRLLAEGRPVAVWGEYAWRAELDIVDLCLAKGVALAGQNTHHFDVYGWAGDDGPGGRDLKAIAADAGLRPLLAKGVRDAVHRLRTGSALDSPALPATTIARTFGAAGLVEVYREVLEELATQAIGGTVLSLDELLVELAPLWSPAGAALAPAAFEALRTVDVAAMLAHSLRSGLLEEYVLPGFEELAAQKLNLQIAQGWPTLVVHDNRSAHLIQPDGSVVEHVFRYPAAGSGFARSQYAQTFCHPVDGDLLVRWGTESGSVAGYWFSDPGEIFETNWSGLHPAWGTRGVPSLPLPGGGVTRGGRPWHAGDTKPPDQTYGVAGDGVNFWRCETYTLPTGGIGWQWREFDPQTGAAGRVSVPSFFARPLPDGATLVAQMCELRPAPAEFAGSPLGWRDGMIGWRLATLPDGGQLGESVDGRGVEWRPAPNVVAWFGRAPDLLGALSLPGDDAPRPITTAGHGNDAHTMWTADGRFPTVRCGPSATLPPIDRWHGFKPRDPHGSAALRTADDKLAGKLLTGSDKKGKGNLAKLLPEVSDGTLRAAVGAVVERAVVLRERLDGVEALLAAGSDGGFEPETVTDEALRKAWKGLVTRDLYYYSYYSGPHSDRRDMLPQLRAVGKLLAGKKAQSVPVELPAWSGLLAGPGAAALRAASPVTDDEDRAALSGLLTALAESGLADGGHAVRAATFNAKEELKAFKVLRTGDQTTVLLGGEKHWDSGVEQWIISGFQRSPSGRFTTPPGMTLDEEIVPGGWSGGGRLRAFTRLLAAHGAAPWRPESVDRLVDKTGMTRPEAAMLLAGLPGLDGWEANFLTPQQRSVMGINTTQARVARDGLKELSLEDRVALLDSAMPADPAALWENGPDVDGLARRWIALRGVRVAVPEQLITEAAKVIPKQHVTDVLQTIAEPSPGSWLTTDGKTTRDGGYYNLQTKLPDGVPGTPFDGDYAYCAAIALAWLAYHLPWGDPVRAALPAALELTRQRLRNPDLLTGYGSYPDGKRPQGVGPALVEGQSHYGSTVVSVAPSRLDGPDDPALGFVNEDVSFALRLLLSRELAETVAIPEGAQGDPRDPRVSVAGLVKEVAGKLGADEDAAAYYLQLLALPDPTDRNVLVWNGWKAPQLKAVQKALTDAGHVLAAKRERAGRPVFLPGGWLINKPPSPPMETWKASMYRGHKNLTLVTMPVPELFRTAWARVTSGDAPRYHDLKETR